MRLSKYLDPELILIHMETTGMEDTIKAMTGRLGETGYLADPTSAGKAILERERSHTTSLGNGVALPHATVAGVEKPLIVVATAPHGIEFGPPSESASLDRLFFLLLSPLEAAGAHIKLLARIVRLVRHDEFVDRLLAAETAKALIEEIEREDALHV